MAASRQRGMGAERRGRGGRGGGARGDQYQSQLPRLPTQSVNGAGQWCLRVPVARAACTGTPLSSRLQCQDRVMKLRQERQGFSLLQLRKNNASVCMKRFPFSHFSPTPTPLPPSLPCPPCVEQKTRLEAVCSKNFREDHSFLLDCWAPFSFPALRDYINFIYGNRLGYPRSE